MTEKDNRNILDRPTDRPTDRDWIGNSKSVYTPLGASNHSLTDREENDFYATDCKAVDYLLENGAEVSHNIWEVACGRGDLSKRLELFGYDVKSTDLFDRGYGESGVDFLKQTEIWDGTILTNPPYKFAKEFVEHSLDIVAPGQSVYMFLKLQFLEGKGRKALFDRNELKTVYVSRNRITCAKNGEFKDTKSSAVAYAWFHWQKGYNGDPVIKWIN